MKLEIDTSCGNTKHSFIVLRSIQVQRDLEKAKKEEERLRKELNNAREREKEEKKRVKVVFVSSKNDSRLHKV